MPQVNVMAIFPELSNTYGSFSLAAYSPSCTADPAIPLAAASSGNTGVLDLELVRTDAIAAALSRLSGKKGSLGIRIDASRADAITGILSDDIRLVIITSRKQDVTVSGLLRFLHGKGVRVFQEARSLDEALKAQKDGFDGIVARGTEAAGPAGELTSFVLLQKIAGKVTIPVWAHGGVGLSTIAACYAAGASGAVFDSQLLLLEESCVKEAVKSAVARMDGSETALPGLDLGCPWRVYARPGNPSIEKVNAKEASGPAPDEWHEFMLGLVGWEDGQLWPLGQDASFASSFSSYVTVEKAFRALKASLACHVSSAKSAKPLAKGAPLAKSIGVDFPIFQGPMARVSDCPAFAKEVAKNNGLPFIAISTLKKDEAEGILKETASALGERPWGVGLLGFNQEELYREQLKVVSLFSPGYAVLAGGMPAQAKELESLGIKTFTHVQSASILEMFVEEGLRRFIFEGNECGGHIGPKTSFVLWEGMVRKLESLIKAGQHRPGEFEILLAGGIHDSVSAAMCAAIMGPLAKKGVKAGALLGTAYLFTEEITATGAISPVFQENAIACKATRVLEISPGHSVRSIESPFADSFNNLKRKMRAEGAPSEEVRKTLEELILGKSRIASKGLDRNRRAGEKGQPYLVPVDTETQKREGLFMVGQLAACRERATTIKELHEAVSVASTALVASIREVECGSKSDIAIVGASCLLPGALDAGKYWENILGKKITIREVPADRWDTRQYFDKDPETKDRVYSTTGGFLEDVPFDPLVYGMPPSTLKSIEPLHLLTLEAARSALKDAGFLEKGFDRESTSVIIGTGGGIGELGQAYVLRSALTSFFESPEEAFKFLPEWTEDSFPGILMNVLAGRVANRFNLGGVNYTVDAACASSLAALYDGCRELESGTSDTVLVGGADAGQNPFAYLCFCKTHALSKSGKCSVFDEKADGTVISEGVVFLVLKRLADAERDGDRIYAVIKSVAGSSDGRQKGMTAPNPMGQLAAMKRAYSKAGFSPATLGLIEAHGTGTVVGDQTEAESASLLLKENGAPVRSCAIGSVKSMIGHTKGAAGLAGLLKAALSLYYKTMPPTAGVDKPNPKADFKTGPLYLNIEARPWMANEFPRRAGVNAFGFGGTNFHAVLEEYGSECMAGSLKHELFIWSADSASQMAAALSGFKESLTGARGVSLSELAYTAHLENSAKEARYRLAIVASSIDDLIEKALSAIKALNGGAKDISDPRGVYYTENPVKGKVAFLFPGQGSQYPGMLSELAMHFREVREAFEKADGVLAERVNGRLSDYIFPVPHFSPEEEKAARKELARTNIAQSALGAASFGAFRLLGSFGVCPDMSAGHSYGEYTALAAAGVFTEEDLYRVSEARGRSIIEAAEGSDLGSMAAVKAGAAEVEEALKGVKGVVVANINSPKQTVISGGREALKEAAAALESKGLQSQQIPVAGAFHSPLVAPAKARFSGFLSTIGMSTPSMDVYSNNSAMPHPADAATLRASLVEHIVRPVRFVDEIESMYASGARIFIECGSGSVLTNLTKQILEGKEFLSVAVDASGAALQQMVKALGQLAANGVSVSLERLYRGRNLKRLDLFKLAEAGKGSATAWVVNGSSVRQGRASSRWPSERFAVAKKGEAQLKARHELQPGRAADAPFASNRQSHEVLMQFQQMMSRFLETQKEVMMSYLGSAPEDYASMRAPVTIQSEPVPVVKPEKPFEKKEPVPQVAAPKGHSKESVSAELLRIAAERTGYPVEMLNTKVDMEAELGIDSIKRVEIMNAFVKTFDGGNREAMAAVMDELSKLKTLDAIVERSLGALGDSGQQIENAPAAAPAAGPRHTVKELMDALLKVAAERTGYPVEMLNTEVDMEAELGIDSIKRVEIMNGFVKSIEGPGKEALRAMTDELSKLKTLDAIVERSLGALSVSKGGQQIESAQAAAPAAGARHTGKELMDALLKVAAERTGYPVEMLNTEVDMEAELGIDSIKRVEIMNGFAKSFDGEAGGKLKAAVDELSRIKTMKGVADMGLRVLGSEEASRACQTAPALVKPSSPGAPRFVLREVDAPVPAKTPVFGSGLVLITDDGAGYSDALASRIEANGGKALVIGSGGGAGSGPKRAENITDLSDWAAVSEAIGRIRSARGRIEGLIHLRPLRKGSATDFKSRKKELRADIKGLYCLSKALKTDLNEAVKGGFGWLFSVMADDTQSDCLPGQDGAAGFLKTAALEWPGVRCKAVTIEKEAPAEKAASLLLSEMAINGQVEVRFEGGRRKIIKAVAEEISANGKSQAIQKDWVIVITGGARGITAEIALEMAERYGPKLILVGRSAPSEESAATAGVEDKELKPAIIADMRARGLKFAVTDIERELSRITAEREVGRNLRKIKDAGSEVHYYAADVRDEAALGSFIDRIYRDFGRIDGVVHGAGVIEDKLIEDKTPESFDRVFDTKVDGALIFLEKLRPASLKFMAFFTSVAGFFGNRGQGDYAAANEAVKGIGRYMDRRWPARVLAVHWGPWDKTGMVTPEVRSQFAEKGIELVPPVDGRRLFVDEIVDGKKGELEIVIGGGPWRT
jgi:acyl transferase domain-containing protein/NAD(P)H-dependent flavin oxidoreductase YrpB (nitropropane dioxygenase family)/NAD(P)-dependent dehydrogenase (short-subunit alcohol dehydrogenase family)